MNTKNEDFIDINALRASAYIALKKARMYGTKLAVKRNGKVVLENPEEFERRLSEDLKS